MGQEELTGDPNPNKGWCTLIFKNNQHGLSFKKKFDPMQLNIICWLILICHLYAEREVPSCISKAFFSLCHASFTSQFTDLTRLDVYLEALSLLMCSSVESFIWALLPFCPPSDRQNKKATCISLNRQLIATLTEVSSFFTSSVIAGIPLHWFPSSDPYSKSWKITVERLLSILW